MHKTEGTQMNSLSLRRIVFTLENQESEKEGGLSTGLKCGAPVTITLILAHSRTAVPVHSTVRRRQKSMMLLQLYITKQESTVNHYIALEMCATY